MTLNFWSDSLRANRKSVAWSNEGVGGLLGVWYGHQVSRQAVTRTFLGGTGMHFPIHPSRTNVTAGSDELRLVLVRDGSRVETPSELCVSFLTHMASHSYVHSYGGCKSLRNTYFFVVLVS